MSKNHNSSQHRITRGWVKDTTNPISLINHTSESLRGLKSGHNPVFSPKEPNHRTSLVTRMERELSRGLVLDFRLLRKQPTNEVKKFIIK